MLMMLTFGCPSCFLALILALFRCGKTDYLRYCFVSGDFFSAVVWDSDFGFYFYDFIQTFLGRGNSYAFY
jgi:hypothetical protein